MKILHGKLYDPKLVNGIDCLIGKKITTRYVSVGMLGFELKVISIVVNDYFKIEVPEYSNKYRLSQY
jgi:hypothetical protein